MTGWSVLPGTAETHASDVVTKKTEYSLSLG